MQYIKHRVNQVPELHNIRSEWGVEIDLRSNIKAPNQILLSHNPWTEGPDFRDWLTEYCLRKIKGPLILNTKEDGLEEQAVKLLHQFGVQDYFFLDTAIPTLVKWTTVHHKAHFAVRLSSFEPIELCHRFSGLVDWVWVDCFNGIPLDPNLFEALTQFRLCLVSPELQGKPLETRRLFSQLLPRIDAICTKDPRGWETTL